GGNGVQIAKIASARVGEGVGPRPPTANRNPASTANPAANPSASTPDRAPTAAQQAGIPEAKTPEQRRKQQADNVGAITEDNPLLLLDVAEVSEGHKFVLTVKNI